jgi:hypothetical protein
MPDEPECRAEVAGQQKDHLVAVLWRTNRLTLRYFNGAFSMLGVVLGTAKPRRSGGAFLRQHNTVRLLFRRLSKVPKETAAKMRPAALSASVRIMPAGIPRSSRAIRPSNRAVAAAVGL